MRRTGVLLALALVLATAVPAVSPAPTSAHTCTLDPHRPTTVHNPTQVMSTGDATCSGIGYMRLTFALQHQSTELGWFTWKTKTIEANDVRFIGDAVFYNGCLTGAWRLKLTLHAVSITGHSHTQTSYSLTHWSGC